MGTGGLARRAKLDIRTIERVQATDGEVHLTIENENALKQALTNAGVEFTNGGQPGVRLKKS